MSNDDGTKTAMQVLAEYTEGNASYRMLDYWLRIGAIKIEHNASGTGSVRTFTPTECEAARLFIKEYKRIKTEQASITDGTLWDQCMLRATT